MSENTDQHFAASDTNWPWRITVLNPAKIVERIRTKVTPARLGQLLHDLSHDACRIDPQELPKINKTGSWSASAKNWTAAERKCISAMLKYAAEFTFGGLTDTLAHSAPITRDGSDWGEPWVDPSKPLLSMLWVLNGIPPILWEVPSIERRHLSDDFVPFMLSPLWHCKRRCRKSPALGREAGWYEVAECMALHQPRGMRTTADVSALAWQGWKIIKIIDQGYQRHRDEVRAAWGFNEPDPLQRFLDVPNADTHGAAVRFLGQSPSEWTDYHSPQNYEEAWDCGETKRRRLFTSIRYERHPESGHRLVRVARADLVRLGLREPT